MRLEMKPPAHSVGHTVSLGLLRRLRFGSSRLGVLGGLSAGVRAKLGLADAAEAFATRRVGAVVPVRLSESVQSRPDFALVHASLYAVDVSVSNTGLDTVTMLCYNGSVGYEKETHETDRSDPRGMPGC
jgi:hypothetical protein